LGNSDVVLLGRYSLFGQNPNNGSTFSFLILVLDAPLSDSATHIDIRPFAVGDLSHDGNVSVEEDIFGPTGHEYRYITSGFISTTGPGSAPEPSTVLSVISGLGIIGRIASQERRRRAN
jgi:hypothetical protein